MKKENMEIIIFVLSFLLFFSILFNVLLMMNKVESDTLKDNCNPYPDVTAFQPFDNFPNDSPHLYCWYPTNDTYVECGNQSIIRYADGTAFNTTNRHPPINFEEYKK